MKNTKTFAIKCNECGATEIFEYKCYWDKAKKICVSKQWYGDMAWIEFECKKCGQKVHDR